MVISNKRVILRFDGCLEDGFRVSLEVGEEGVLHSASGDGFLPANSGLVDCLAAWQESYRGLAQVTRIQVKQITVQKAPDRSVEDCRRDGRELERLFQQWLGSEPFRVIDNQLREAVGRQDLVRMVIRTQDRRLHLLPWHTWDFVDRYQAEVGFSFPSRQASEPIALSQFGKVKILAILGHSAGIDTQADRKLLEGLPDADVKFLVEPDRQQINDQLWEQRWDILFFAGHSLTQDEAGVIHINSGDSLTVAELKYGLRRAIDRGLQLAIFNSCDGLGLAYEIEQMGLPQMVVMRQPVPDSVAQAFLKDLLASFVGGQRFYLAVREAREKLQRFEQKYPCASWLPVIFQNPTQPALSWEDFRDSRGTIAPVQKSRIQASLPKKKLCLRMACLTAICVAGSIVGARRLGWLEQSELWAYDRLEVLQPKNSIKDDRIFLIRVTDEDYKAFQEYPIYDQTYATLLSKLQSHQPAVIGFDIYRDIPIPSVPEKKGQSQPISNGRRQLLDVLTKSQNTIALCQVPDIGDSNDFHAPEGVPKENLGFSNVPKDSAQPSLNIQRRYFFHMAAKPSCETSSSLGFQVAASYLRQKNIKVFRENTEFTIVGKAKFERLEGHNGGYQGEDSGGHRVLINYRRPLEVAGNSMTLTEFLNEKSEQTLAHLVKNRIVLIGADKKDGSDRFLTPYTGQDGYPIGVPGIMIHAQMVSYLIDAAEGERPVMWMWKPWGDGLWILSWASVGSLMVYFFQKNTHRIVAACIVVIVVNGVCWFILVIGGWVPLIPTIFALLGTEVCLMIDQFYRIR